LYQEMWLASVPSCQHAADCSHHATVQLVRSPARNTLKTIAIHRNTHVHLLARRIPSQGMSSTVECPLNYFGIKFHMADVVDDLALRAQEVFTAQQDKKVMKKLKLCKCAKTCQYCSH